MKPQTVFSISVFLLLLIVWFHIDVLNEKIDALNDDVLFSKKEILTEIYRYAGG